MELIDLLLFPGVVIAGMLISAFAAYDKKLARIIHGFYKSVQ
jgi:hypothetical protein